MSYLLPVSLFSFAATSVQAANDPAMQLQTVQAANDARIQTAAISAFVSLNAIIVNRLFMRHFRRLREVAIEQGDLPAIRIKNVLLMCGLFMDGLNIWSARRDLKILFEPYFSDNKQSKTNEEVEII